MNPILPALEILFNKGRILCREIYLPSQLINAVLKYVKENINEFVIDAMKDEEVKKRISCVFEENDISDNEKCIIAALKEESVITKLCIKAKKDNEISLLLNLLHHEGNHASSALLTGHREAGDEFRELWNLFITRLERAGIEQTKIESKARYILFVNALIKRSTKLSGNDSESILLSIRDYSFNKRIRIKESKKILSKALTITGDDVKIMEQCKSINDMTAYARENISGFDKYFACK